MKFKMLTFWGALCALGSVVSTPAAAAQVYDWSYTNASDVVVASGTLTTGAADGGGFDVTGVTGFVNDPAVNIDGAITGFLAGAANSNYGYGFNYNNIIYTSGPHVDNFGVVFDVGSNQVNIYNMTPTYPGVFPGGDELDSLIAPGANGQYLTDASGTFNIAAAPEPATWVLMFLGVGMIGGGLRMARRKTDMALTAA